MSKAFSASVEMQLSGFPDSSVSKESACGAGDPSLIPGLGRSAGVRDRLPTPVFLGFPDSSDSKVSTCNARDLGSIPGSGRSPGGGYGNLLQYSCLENPHGQRSLVDYSPWGRRESDTTEVTEYAHTCMCIADSLCCTVETNTTL